MRGTKILSALLAIAAVVPQLAAVHVPPRHHGSIHGTKADDVLEGTDSGERIAALSGRDRIIALGGDDVLEGGPGADVLSGGPGDDTYVVHGDGDGPDLILEESGTDVLKVSDGRVTAESIEYLRHGDDLLMRWAQARSGNALIIRSWFAGAAYRVEELQLAGRVPLALEQLAAHAKAANSEDIAPFASFTGMN